MTPPQRSDWVRSSLRPASALWGLVARSRNFLYDRRLVRTHRLPAAVISIGNITAGGTGKTPLTIHLARRLQQEGIRPLVLSRGYRSQGSGTRIVSDRERVLLGPDQAGDEPVLIAASAPGVPVIVDPNRSRGGLEAIRRFDPQVILLDDGFQHRRLSREMDIVLLDAVDPFGMYAMLPTGTLREPFKGLARADFFVVTHAPDGEPLATLTSVIRRYNEKAPIQRARHAPDALVPLVAAPPGGAANGGPASLDALPTPLPLDQLRNTAVYAFCGIGNPEGFRATLQAAGARILELRTFRDHHPYTRADLADLLASADRAGAERIVTTEKDAVRIRNLEGAARILALRIRLDLSDEPALMKAVMAVVRR